MASNRDLISLLPEILTTTILSLLPLKEAVRTSVLAKHWRNLWHIRPNVEINEHHFPPSHHASRTDLETLTRQFSCICFGRTWLQPFQSGFPNNLSSFTLVFSSPSRYRFDIEFFLRFALAHRTRFLELDFSGLDWDNCLPITDSGTYSERFTLPEFVYKYQELESLKLVSCRFRDDRLENIGCSLTSVSLGWIEINASALKNITGSCPCLKSLSLFKCFNLTVYVIESESLKRLTVDKCVDLLNLSVLAPNLESFTYCGNVVEFGMGEFPLLKEADLDFRLAEFLDVDNGDKIIDLFSIVYFTKSLRVCAYVTQILFALDIPRLQGRARVKDLTIKTAFHEYEFLGILCLLNSFPFLEKICFEVGRQNIFDEDDYARVPILDYSPEMFCLKGKPSAVEIKGFRGVRNEFRVLLFLLGHGQYLQKLILRVAEDDQQANTMAIQLKDTLIAKLSHLDVVIIS